jgi:hypothetical protein
VEPGDRGILRVRTHFKSHSFAGQRSDVGRLRGLSTGNTSRSVGPQMLGRLPTTAVLPAPARIFTAAGRASIRAATWTAAEIAERRTSEICSGRRRNGRRGLFIAAGGTGRQGYAGAVSLRRCNPTALKTLFPLSNVYVVRRAKKKELTIAARCLGFSFGRLARDCPQRRGARRQ